MDTILKTYFGMEWHHGETLPELARPVYALIEEDVSPTMQPEPELGLHFTEQFSHDTALNIVVNMLYPEPTKKEKLNA